MNLVKVTLAVILVGLIVILFCILVGVRKTKQNDRNKSSDIPFPDIGTFGEEISQTGIPDEQDQINARLQELRRQRQERIAQRHTRNYELMQFPVFADVIQGWDVVPGMPELRININPRINALNNLTDLVASPPPVPRERSQDIDEYYQNLETHDDSSQNVHDSQINSYLTRKYSRLLELNNEIESCIDSISEHELNRIKKNQTFIEISRTAERYIDHSLESGAIDSKEARLRTKKIDMILSKIQQGYTITSIDPDYNQLQEDDILVNVWERIHQPCNSDNHVAMEVALIDALLDAVEEKNQIQNAMDNIIGRILDHATGNDNPIVDPFVDKYGTVCINGRVAHVLSCFTLLDADEVLREPEKDHKEVANEAYMKANQILNNEMETYKIKIPELQNTSIEELYTTVDQDRLSDREQKAVECFENHVKRMIKDQLLIDYKNIVPAKQLNEIIKAAQAGV